VAATAGTVHSVGALTPNVSTNQTLVNHVGAALASQARTLH